MWLFFFFVLVAICIGAVPLVMAGAWQDYRQAERYRAEDRERVARIRERTRQLMEDVT